MTFDFFFNVISTYFYVIFYLFVFAEERKIDFNGDEYVKVRDAISKLKEKGGRDSLVITDKAAYIVDVANNKVVTSDFIF